VDYGILCLVFGISRMQRCPLPTHGDSVPWRRAFLAILGHISTANDSLRFSDFKAWQPGVSDRWKPIKTRDVSSLKAAIRQVRGSANARLKDADASLNQLRCIGKTLNSSIETMSREVGRAKETMANVGALLKSIDDKVPCMQQSSGRSFSDMLHRQMESQIDHPWLRAARYAAEVVEADMQCVEARKDAAVKEIEEVTEELRAVLDEAL
jgi:chromosome segregation ATPase